MLSRREILQGAAAGALFAPRLLQAQTANKLTANLTVVNAGGTNVVVCAAGDSLTLVDSGAAGSGDALVAALKGIAASGKVQTLFNTHYHLDQTANNERFTSQGAKVVAHARTQEWMATDYWMPAEQRWMKARPKAALPTETFREKGSIKVGNEQVDYGYLLMAHTSGDIYVQIGRAHV